MSKPAWMVPIQYNDPRFDDGTEVKAPGGAVGKTFDDDRDVRDARDVDELLHRPDTREEREYECNDVTPVDYSRGPHDEEFGVGDSEFDGEDPDPIDYDSGPDDMEYGVEDDE